MPKPIYLPRLVSPWSRRRSSRSDGAARWCASWCSLATAARGETDGSLLDEPSRWCHARRLNDHGCAPEWARPQSRWGAASAPAVTNGQPKRYAEALQLFYGYDMDEEGKMHNCV